MLNGMGYAFPMVVNNFNADTWTECMTPIAKAITARLNEPVVKEITGRLADVHC